MCRYAQSCAFISVIELPRIPAYYPKLYIQNGKVSESAPDKILKEKTPDNTILDSLHYDNTSPRDSDGNELFYDNKRHNLNSAQYQYHEEMRKKNSS